MSAIEQLTLTQIAERINAHLRRFEADPQINRSMFYTSSLDGQRHSSGRSYYGAGAHRGGARIVVHYIAYQHSSTLTRQEALDYLRWLDAGNVGRHYEQQGEGEG